MFTRSPRRELVITQRGNASKKQEQPLGVSRIIAKVSSTIFLIKPNPALDASLGSGLLARLCGWLRSIPTASVFSLAAVLGIAAGFGKVAVCAFQAGILVAMSQLASKIGVAFLVAFILFDCTFAPILILGRNHNGFSLQLALSSYPLSSAIGKAIRGEGVKRVQF
jgi:hypothetical protein